MHSDCQRLQCTMSILGQDSPRGPQFALELLKARRIHRELGKGCMLGDIEHDLPQTLHLDGQKVRQVVLNLVSNALKFTRDGVVTVRATVRDGVLVASVEDTGIGIPADRLEAVFESFEQAEADTSQKFGGTGLGLAISRRFCRLMDGDLTVRSTVGEGSVFELQVPLG